LRIFMFMISLIAPATYVAVTTFHQEMVPTTLIVAIAAQREAVPFPAFVEALLMEITFEILREAGIRLPKAIGSAVSIVGALVIGQAAVQASIVSPAMVIIVSITAIASFATPSFDMAISARLIRFLFMIGAATFGFYGIILCLLLMVVHLCGLRSFGVPYMAPFAPFIPVNNGDTVVRLPWWSLRQRPRLITANTIREGTNQHPHPPASRGMVNRDFEEGNNNEA
jgi:spore germination protein KA